MTLKQKANASDIDKNVRPEFKLDWRAIKFMRLLGSGTFGDCYMGLMGASEVAVSWILVMRTWGTECNAGPAAARGDAQLFLMLHVTYS